MSIFLLSGRRLLSTGLVRTARAAGLNSPLPPSFTSNPFAALMKQNQSSRVYSTGKDDKEPDNANILRDDAFKGLKAGGLLGLLYGVDRFVKGGTLKESVDYGLKSALREGMKGAAAGSVIGAVSSDNPEDKERIKIATKDGVANGVLTGVLIGGVVVPLAFFTMNNDPQFLAAVALVGAVLCGGVGACIGPVVTVALAGLSSNHPPKAPVHVDKYMAFKDDIVKVREYWMAFVGHHHLGEDHFKEYIQTMNTDEFRVQFERMQELQQECSSLAGNEKLTLSMHRVVKDNMRAIDNVMKIAQPVMDEINELNRYSFRV